MKCQHFLARGAPLDRPADGRPHLGRQVAEELRALARPIESERASGGTVDAHQTPALADDQLRDAGPSALERAEVVKQELAALHAQDHQHLLDRVRDGQGQREGERVRAPSWAGDVDATHDVAGLGIPDGAAEAHPGLPAATVVLGAEHGLRMAQGDRRANSVRAHGALRPRGARSQVETVEGVLEPGVPGRVDDAAMGIGEQDHVTGAGHGPRRVVQYPPPRLTQVFASQDRLDLVERDPLGRPLHEGVDLELAALLPAARDRGTWRSITELAGAHEPLPGRSDLPKGTPGVRRNREAGHLPAGVPYRILHGWARRGIGSADTGELSDSAAGRTSMMRDDPRDIWPPLTYANPKDVASRLSRRRGGAGEAMTDPRSVPA